MDGKQTLGSESLTRPLCLRSKRHAYVVRTFGAQVKLRALMPSLSSVIRLLFALVALPLCDQTEDCDHVWPHLKKDIQSHVLGDMPQVVDAGAPMPESSLPKIVIYGAEPAS